MPQILRVTLCFLSSHASKKRSFSRFGSSVDCSSGEPLVGVGAPTVGADLCVRLSSPERSLFCGRTRSSAHTRITSTRQFHSSNAVTPISVGADLCVRPSSPERSLFCGRTRRSAPTQATSARQFHSSNAVTPIFVGTHGRCVRCIKARRVAICGDLGLNEQFPTYETRVSYLWYWGLTNF